MNIMMISSNTTQIRRGTVLLWLLVISVLGSADATGGLGSVNGFAKLGNAIAGIYGYLNSQPWNESAIQHNNMNELYNRLKNAHRFVALSKDTYKSNDRMITQDFDGYKRWKGLDNTTIDDLKVENGRVFVKKNNESNLYADHPIISIWRKEVGEKTDYIFAIRGTKSNVDLLVSDVQIAGNSPLCQNPRWMHTLTVVRAALLKMGDPRYFTIQTCGHSLGGYVSAILFHKGFNDLFNEDSYTTFAEQYGIVTDPSEMSRIVESLLGENYSINPGSSCWKGETFEMWKGIVANPKVKIIRRHGDAVSASMRMFFKPNQKKLGNIHEILNTGEKENMLAKHKMGTFLKYPKPVNLAERFKSLISLKQMLSKQLEKIKGDITRRVSASVDKKEKKIIKEMKKVSDKMDEVHKRKLSMIPEMHRMSSIMLHDMQKHECLKSFERQLDENRTATKAAVLTKLFHKVNQKIQLEIKLQEADEELEWIAILLAEQATENERAKSAMKTRPILKGQDNNGASTFTSAKLVVG